MSYWVEFYCIYAILFVKVEKKNIVIICMIFLQANENGVKYMKKETLFISYNWKDGSAYADELEAQLEDKFDVKRDKSQLIANDNIFDFMAEIANCENVIIVLTSEYLKSVNCMLEMSYLVKQDDWEMKSMTLVIDETIYATENKLSIISYWYDKQNQLNQQIESVNQGLSILQDEKMHIDYICEEVEKFLKGISRRKNPTQIAIVNEFIKKSERNRTSKKTVIEQGEEFIKSFLDKNGELTVRELAEQSGKSMPAAHRIVADMVEKGILERTQMGRISKYSLKE